MKAHQQARRQQPHALALRVAHAGKHAAAKTSTRKGLVVVHGVGTERQSSTIMFMGAPLIDWVRRWVEAHDRTVRVNQTALRFGSSDDDPNQPPPHVHITLGSVDDDGDSPVGADTAPEELTPRQRSIEPFDWIMTEAWWAWSSISPSVIEVTMWLMHNFGRAIVAFWRNKGTRVLDLAGSITRKQTDRVPLWARWALWLDLVLTLVILVVSVAAIFPGFLGLIALILLSQVPIQAVQNFALVSPVASFLTVNGGQMFTLANDEVQAANLRGRLERAIRFLQSQGCKEIYVMAHSAGSVVSYETLCALGDIWQRNADPGQPRAVPPPVVKLFTMGEGLNLDWRLQPRKWWTRPHQWRLFMPLRESIHWVDFWAGHDIVPSGPITLPERIVDHVRTLPRHLQRSHRFTELKPEDRQVAESMKPCAEEEVTNWMDILNDHGGYWDNDEEVLSRLACEIESKPTETWKDSQFYEETYIESGRAHRLVRVGALAAIRLTFYVLLVAALFEPRTYALGRAVLDAIGSIPGISAIGNGANAAVSGATKALSLSPNTPVIGPLGAVMDGMPALLVLAALYLLLYNVVAYTLWQQWDVQMRLTRIRQAAGRQAEKWRVDHKQATERKSGRQTEIHRAGVQPESAAEIKKLTMNPLYYGWLLFAIAVPLAVFGLGWGQLGSSFALHATEISIFVVVPFVAVVLVWLARLLAR